MSVIVSWDPVSQTSVTIDEVTVPTFVIRDRRLRVVQRGGPTGTNQEWPSPGVSPNRRPSRTIITAAGLGSPTIVRGVEPGSRVRSGTTSVIGAPIIPRSPSGANNRTDSPSPHIAGFIVSGGKGTSLLR